MVLNQLNVSNLVQDSVIHGGVLMNECTKLFLCDSRGLHSLNSLCLQKEVQLEMVLMNHETSTVQER